LLCALWVEAKLPGRAALEVVLTFREGQTQKLDELSRDAEARGYRILSESLTITSSDNQPVWRFGVMALERSRAVSPALLAEELVTSGGVRFSIVPVWN
jgi:hypothetical protein